MPGAPVRRAGDPPPIVTSSTTSSGPSRHKWTLWQPAHPCRVGGARPWREPRSHRAIDAARPLRVRTTDSRHDFPIAPNLLDRDFTAGKPDQIWLADITYIETDQGWRDLAAAMDLYSRGMGLDRGGRVVSIAWGL